MDYIASSTFLPAIFWMVMGILNVFFIMSLRTWLHDLGLKLSKIKWICIISWWITLHLLIAASFTLVGEDEINAAVRFGGFFLIPMLFSGIAIYRWIFKRKTQ
jgi:hypothetical protein